MTFKTDLGVLLQSGQFITSELRLCCIMKKKEKLHIITPSGKEVELGFLSPCRNGVVMGTTKVEDYDKHLTIIAKEDTLSAHITPQEHPENKRYFPPIKKSQIVNRFKKMVEQEIISPMPVNQLSKKVLYFTQKFENWFAAMKNVLFQKMMTKKEIIHIINLKEFSEKAPQFVDEVRKNPSDFLGLCSANEILDDETKIVGIDDTGLLLLPFEDQLYRVNLCGLLNFSLNSTLKKREISYPLEEIYSSFGIPQYMEEIEKKKIFQKLLSISTE